MAGPINSISPWEFKPNAAQGSAAKGRDEKDAIKEAAVGFETVLMRQWLREVRKSSLSSDNSASTGYLEMADDQMATVLARNGGMGLARQLSSQLLKQVEAAGLSARPEIAVKAGKTGDK